MRSSTSSVAVLALLPALAAGPACRKTPAVEVEQVYELPRSSDSRPRVLPPRCQELPKAPYPDLPFDVRPIKLSVRVDFTLDESGKPEHLEPTVLDRPDNPASFVRAAVAAAELIRCEPAARLPRPGMGETAPVPQKYRSSVICHFFRDEREAGASFR